MAAEISKPESWSQIPIPTTDKIIVQYIISEEKNTESNIYIKELQKDLQKTFENGQARWIFPNKNVSYTYNGRYGKGEPPTGYIYVESKDAVFPFDFSNSPKLNRPGWSRSTFSLVPVPVHSGPKNSNIDSTSCKKGEIIESKK